MTDLTLTKSVVEALASFGGATGVGAVIGYGFKKLLKILLMVLAVLTALVAVPIGYLTYLGVIKVDFDKLYALINSAGTAGISALTNLVQTISIALPVLGGFAAGFAIGFKKG